MVCWLNDLCMRTGLVPRLPFAKSEQVYGLVAGFSYYNYRNLHPDNNIAVHHISHRSGTRTWISYDVLHEAKIYIQNIGKNRYFFELSVICSNIPILSIKSFSTGESVSSSRFLYLSYSA